jgi:hypothetical protein
VDQKRKKWQEKLIEFECYCRAKRPLYNRKSMSEAEKLQSDIIFSSLASQLNGQQSRLPAETEYIVFTSSTQGLV